jgi:hypothetical protein
MNTHRGKEMQQDYSLLGYEAMISQICTRFWRNMLPLMKFTLKMKAVLSTQICRAKSQKTTVLILTASGTSDLTDKVDHLVIGFALGDLCSVLRHGDAGTHGHAWCVSAGSLLVI